MAAQIHYGFFGTLYMLFYAVVGLALGACIGRLGRPGWTATLVATAVALALAWAVQVWFDYEPRGALAVLFLAAFTFPLGYRLTSKRRAADAGRPSRSPT